MTTSLTHEHVRHLHNQKQTLQQKIEKLKARGAHLTKHTVQAIEVFAGAAAGGVLQGLAKDQVTGARILHVPADLVIGGGLALAGMLDLAGDEWSGHLTNLGTGFIAAYATELGYGVGKRKRESGKWLGAKTAAMLPAVGVPAAPAVVHGAVSPQDVAQQLLNQMQQRQAG